ncbi:DUF4199 domain-containing protein [Belliella kenyensis]|uniref:DUF4199 domain-containing protein n=1 Tax=Belliella kenyensis TaxID=1472724 RepID=A0ABV8EJS7_9BACT|nr:DUF4199 domain-containing protein [Belliella kenyensis]MCH7402451.1 DUF4199 domain-containing protein [Belliella kenyensis]MDN3603642.1 DUF4199 domain-containing protein [Belliella kenyensis]
MSKYFSYAIQIGLLGAAFSIIAFFGIGLILGQDPTLSSQLFSFVTVPLFVGAALYFIRWKLNDNHLSFAEGMTVGFVVYFTNALVSFVGITIGLYLAPSLFEIIKENKLLITADKKDFTIQQYGQEVFDRTYQSISELTVVNIALNDFIWKIVFGLFFTIIISIILRRNLN